MEFEKIKKELEKGENFSNNIVKDGKYLWATINNNEQGRREILFLDDKTHKIRSYYSMQSYATRVNQLLKKK
tara:strand:+ start:123 stop:338 length:216 start_codon:yes stop_codon:yes gene_type:complete